jgi:hypothetical protein
MPHEGVGKDLLILKTGYDRGWLGGVRLQGPGGAGGG